MALCPRIIFPAVLSGYIIYENFELSSFHLSLLSKPTHVFHWSDDLETWDENYLMIIMIYAGQRHFHVNYFECDLTDKNKMLTVDTYLIEISRLNVAVRIRIYGLFT